MSNSVVRVEESHTFSWNRGAWERCIFFLSGLETTNSLEVLKPISHICHRPGAHCTGIGGGYLRDWGAGGEGDDRG